MALSLRAAGSEGELVLDVARVVAPDDVEVLGRALFEHACRMLDAVGIGGGPAPQPIDYSGWDLGFADYLDQVGGRGCEVATKVRARSSERQAEVADDDDGPLLALWDDPDRDPTPPRWLVALATVMWAERQRQAQAAQRKGAPALVLPFACDMARMRPAMSTDDGQLIDAWGERSPLVPIGPGHLDALAQRGLSALDSPTADRLFGWLLRRGFEAYALNPALPVHLYTVRIEGGIEAIAAELGTAGGNARREVGQLLHLLNRCTVGWDVPGVSRAQPLALVHLLEVAKHNHGQRRVVSLGLSPLWTPKLCHLLTGADRLLVPWLELPDVSLLHTRHQRAAVRLWRGVRIALRGQAAELAGGGIHLEWPVLAAEAGLPAGCLSAVVDAWTSEAGPLERIPGGRVTPRDAAVRTMLLEGASVQQHRSRAGQKGVSSRVRRRAAR